MLHGADVLMFFERQAPAALPLYEAFEAWLLASLGPDIQIKVGKTQISFIHRHIFACASLLRVRRKALLPPVYIVVTFGLGSRVCSPRIAAATEPYPGRWTHHLILSDAAQLDDELLGWLRQAYAFAAAKR